MITLAIFLEELSAREMLMVVLPQLMPQGVTFRYVVFQGKQDMEKNLSRRLRGWQTPDTRFIVIRDQDSGDCHVIKQNLTELCRKGGKGDVLVRIACRELESFYLGDLDAVEKGLALNGLSAKQNRKKVSQSRCLRESVKRIAKTYEPEIPENIRVAGNCTTSEIEW